MQTAILTLHVIVCLFLVVLVLLQAGREGMGVIFGGGGNSSVFGSTGAGGILVKLTTILAVVFIVTSLSYNIVTSTGRDEGSTILDVRFGDEVTPPVPAESSVPVSVPSEAAQTPVSSASPDTGAPADTGDSALPVSTETAPADPSASSEPTQAAPMSSEVSVTPATEVTTAPTEPPATSSGASAEPATETVQPQPTPAS